MDIWVLSAEADICNLEFVIWIFLTNGTSLKNIKQRLQIMFPDQFTFHLFEQDGWIYAKILIQCDKMKERFFMAKEGVELEV